MLAKGEEQKIYANPSEGIWFGNANHKTSGRPVNFNSLTKQGQEYANHVNRLLNSPPKNRTQQSVSYTPLPPHTSTSTNPITSQWSSGIPRSNTPEDPRITQLQEDMKTQKQANAQFDQRINKLELTTNKIDSNVDRILCLLQNSENVSPPGYKKTIRTTESMVCDQEEFLPSSSQFQPQRELQQP